MPAVDAGVREEGHAFELFGDLTGKFSVGASTRCRGAATRLFLHLERKRSMIGSANARSFHSQFARPIRPFLEYGPESMAGWGTGGDPLPRSAVMVFW